MADELHQVSDSSAFVTGTDLLRMAAGVHQIIDGDFEAFRPLEARPWLVIHAVDSSLYVVVTGDEKLLLQVRAHFHDVRDSPDDVVR